MSADIIAFPFKAATGIDQQRWIPGPRERRAPVRSASGWLHLAGILGAVASSWILVIGAAQMIANLF